MRVRVNVNHARYGAPGSMKEIDESDADALDLVRRGILTRIHPEPEEPDDRDRHPDA